MATQGTILVTGATGSVASGVVPQLIAAGKKVRALVHSAAKGAALEKAGAEIAVGDFDDASSLDRAFAGVETVFLVTPASDKAVGWAGAAIAAAKRNGTKRVVRLSDVKASPTGPTGNTRSHGETDAELQKSGLAYCILRPNFYMQNLLGSARMIASDGVIQFGMGDGRIGFIDTRDVSDCAAAALRDTRWDGKAWELTGPASLSFHDVAQTLTQVLGRPVKYVAVTPEQVEQGVLQWGMGPWFAGVMRDYSRAYSQGFGDFTTPHVAEMSGHPARSIEAFAREVLAPALKR